MYPDVFFCMFRLLQLPSTNLKNAKFFEDIKPLVFPPMILVEKSEFYNKGNKKK